MAPRAAGIIIKHNQILLLRRIKPGLDYLSFPGGTQEPGEDIAETLKREITEELSLTVMTSELAFTGTGPYIVGVMDEPRDNFYFWVQEFTGEVVLGGPELESMDKDNQYLPTWVPLQATTYINLVPEWARQKFLDWQRAKNFV